MLLSTPSLEAPVPSPQPRAGAFFGPQLAAFSSLRTASADVRLWHVASSDSLQRYVRSWSTSRHGTDIVNVRLQLSRLVYQQRSAQQLRQLGDVRGKRAPGRHRSPDALTCAKLGALCAGDASERTISLHRAAMAKLGPAADSGAFFAATFARAGESDNLRRSAGLGSRNSPLLSHWFGNRFDP